MLEVLVPKLMYPVLEYEGKMEPNTLCYFVYTVVFTIIVDWYSPSRPHHRQDPQMAGDHGVAL